MCTVTWAMAAGAYELLVNRDERRARPAAEPPRAGVRNGVRYLAPRDPVGDGAWVAVNELGVTLCLVNGRQRDPAPAARSRGRLVLELVDGGAPDEIHRRLARLDLDAYAPFALLAVAAGEPPAWSRWDGARLAGPEAAPLPLTSSSWDDDEVARARRRLFTAVQAGGDADPLLAFHRSHRPQRGPLSPCMHRAEAATVSLARVRVRPDAVSIAYAGGPPCRTPPGVPLTLERRVEAVALAGAGGAGGDPRR